MSACQATPTRQTIGFMTVRFILGLPCLLNTLQKKKKNSSRPHNLTSGSLWAVTPINNPSCQGVSDHLQWKYFPWKHIRGTCFLLSTAWCHRLNIVLHSLLQDCCVTPGFYSIGYEDLLCCCVVLLWLTLKWMGGIQQKYKKVIHNLSRDMTSKK